MHRRRRRWTIQRKQDTSVVGISVRPFLAKEWKVSDAAAAAATVIIAATDDVYDW